MILKVKKILLITILFLIRIIHSSNIPKLEKDNNFNFQKTKLLSLLKQINVEEICSRASLEVRDFFEYANFRYSKFVVFFYEPNISFHLKHNLYLHFHQNFLIF